MKKNTYKKIKCSAIATGGAVLSLVAALYLTKDKDTNTLNNIGDDIKKVSSNSLVDDVFYLEENANILDKLDKLDKYLALSNELENFEYSDEVGNIDINLESSKLSLNKEKGLVNTFIYNEGYMIIEEAAKLVVKTKVVEALNLPISEYRNIKISPNRNTNGKDYFDIELAHIVGGNEVKYNLDTEGIFNKDSELGILVKDIYKVQNLKKSKESSKDALGYEVYNSDRNTTLYNILLDIKDTLYTDYTKEENSIKKDNNKEYIKR